MVFPQTTLDTRTELQIGGVWTDITPHVYTRDPITIGRGRKDEGSRCDPTSCALTLNNRGGQYSPRNPRSPYFGLIGRNTPLRVSVPNTESSLVLDGVDANIASTPDVSALDIVGDLDVRIEATADWYATAAHSLMGKWNATGNQRSWRLYLYHSWLYLQWTADGVTIVGDGTALPSLPARAALRATLDVDNGAGGNTIRLYWAPTLAGPWTQFGDTLTAAGVTSIFSGTAALQIATPFPTAAPPIHPIDGRVHQAEVRSGIAGTVVANPDFRAKAPGTTSFADAAGRTWTVNGTAEINARAYQAHTEVSSWPPRWDVSGKDVWTSVESSGILRRLGQGAKSLDSTLRRRVPTGPGLLAYWPMEEERDSTRAYSPIAGVQPMTTIGLDWGADDTLGGSSALPKLLNPASLSASVPLATTVGWQVEMVYFLPTMPAVLTEILRVAVRGTVMRAAVLLVSTAGIRIEARDADDVVLAFFNYTNAPAIADFWGVWNRLQLFTSDAGGGTTRLVAAWRDVTNGAGSWLSATVFTGTMGVAGGVTGTWGSATEGMALGHLGVFAVPGTVNVPGSAIYDGADDGFNGETAGARMLRLAGEEGIPLSLTAPATETARLGPQRPDTLLNLLEEAADADGGILFEPKDRLGLRYRPRTALYNQAPALVLDYTADGEIAPPLEPVEDDLTVRNDRSVTRVNGSTGRVVITEGPLSTLPPPAGIGVYDDAVTLNLYDDTQPQQIAAWRAYLGTIDQARYPAVHVQLHTATHLIDEVLALDIGDLATLTDLPAWLPPDDVALLVQGTTTVLDQYTWDITLDCTPGSPWQVGVADQGRADTSGTTLSGALSSTSLVVNVLTTSGPRWVDSATYPSDFPFDIVVGGEVMRVTSCVGTTTAQTFGVTRSINGIVKSHLHQAPVSLAIPTIVAL